MNGRANSAFTSASVQSLRTVIYLSSGGSAGAAWSRGREASIRCRRALVNQRGVSRLTSNGGRSGQGDHLQGRITPGGDGILAISAIVASAHGLFRRIFLAINGQCPELLGRHLPDRRLMAESHRGKVGGIAPAAGRCGPANDQRQAQR